MLPMQRLSQSAARAASRSLSCGDSGATKRVPLARSFLLNQSNNERRAFSSAAATTSSAAAAVPAAPQVPAKKKAKASDEDGGQISPFVSQRNQLSEAEYIKLIKNPPEYFGQIIRGVASELRKKAEAQGSIPSAASEKLAQQLTSTERRFLLETIFINMCFARPVANNFMKSSMGLPPMGASIYSHLFAGLVNYTVKNSGGALAETGATQDVSPFVRLATYYRSPILVEELTRLGFSRKEYEEAIAKAFFLQYWSGGVKEDPLLFNPMVRCFYPRTPTTHVTTGSNDLGRETEFQVSRLFAMGVEGDKNPPVTVINTGDTGAFTDGFMHAIQHVIEGVERGYKMPIIFLVNANNSSISLRLEQGNPEEGVRKIQQRFAGWGVEKGFTTLAEDIPAGVGAMREAVDYCRSTGKPCFHICSYPFRPLGHANDRSPAADGLLLSQHDTFVQSLAGQVEMIANSFALDGSSETSPGASPAQQLESAAALLEETAERTEKAIAEALNGNRVLTRPEIEELSIPGSKELRMQPGKVIPLDLGYLTGKGKGDKQFVGLGGDLYGQAMEDLFSDCDKQGRPVRYVHQENHHPNSTDTRKGVYGELNLVDMDKHLSKFINFLPQEAQVVQVGMALRSVPALCKGDGKGADGGPLVFVKGPHTIFNEHARDHLKYAAYRHADGGEQANVIYLLDGGSLAAREKEVLFKDDAEKEVTRDLILAKGGEHHNTPMYSSYVSDANTVAAVPLDMNLFVQMLPGMISLHDMGRVVVGFCPTASFGLLHSKLPDTVSSAVGSEGLTQNDCLHVKINAGGSRPATGRPLVVVTWGPDARWIGATLQAQGVEAELIILNYLKLPNSLVAFMGEQIAGHNGAVDVVAVDPNPDAHLLGPIMSNLKDALGYPEELRVSECFVPPTFVPYGLGEGLLAEKDFLRHLQLRGILQRGAEAESVFVESCVDGVRDECGYSAVGTSSAGWGSVTASSLSSADAAATKSSSPAPASDATPASSGTGGGQEVVTAPMQADIASISFTVEEGAMVTEGDIIAEMESDKANVEVVAPTTGKLLKIYVKQDEELKFDMTTELCIIECGGGGSESGGSAGATPTSSLSATTAPAAASAGGSLGAPTNAKPLSRVQRAMVDNMSVRPADTYPFVVGETVDFGKVKKAAKKQGVSPACVLVKLLGDSVVELGLNKKLSPCKKDMFFYGGEEDPTSAPVDIGLAIEVDGQLRVACVCDVTRKSVAEIQDTIKGFQSGGGKLTPQDQDMSTVCYILSTLGKGAPEVAVPVLPRGITGIVAVGAAQETIKNGDKILGSQFMASLCHATLTGSEGAGMIMDLAARAQQL